ncbi:acetyl-CoA synthetase [Thermoactinomyces sp. DSM 45891]|uniref:AMP-binding protein n=1 Tax=Thermoactinomyces sp. DSM 45891 TaxID=1761907 RepID=UPI0009215CCB|nr:AMP-binding protein [Thermoactinomyces sp. DSM 45891]SFX81890.1 acetyl-CoA synthetase [Thermoactinomyces sp. DSM 45891]
MTQPAWTPSQQTIEESRLYQFMKKLGFSDVEEFRKQSIHDVAWFWENVVQDLGIHWTTPYRQVLDQADGVEHAKWFVDGKMNVAYNTLDRFLEDPVSRDRVAIVYENESGKQGRWTYQQLWEEVNKCANGLQLLGLVAGDRVAIYLPMIVENVVAMLAIAKIGAIFSPCFSGFGADALSTRINDCQARFLITADGFTRRGKVVSMKAEADRAVKQSLSIEKVIVVSNLGNEVSMTDDRDLLWTSVMTNMKPLPCYPTDANDPFMIIYTSGTTGRPKGTVHVHAGFPIKAAFDEGYCMDVRKEDVICWVTDMGWMMGPWKVFGTLLNGATIVLFDGTPDYPNPGRLWELVEKYQITHLGISPTLIRVLMKQGETFVEAHDISSLRVFGSTGEPWNPDPWNWLFEKVGKKQVPIFNYSGGTEISGGILGNVIVKPQVPCGFNMVIPGMDIEIYNEEGQPVRGEVGELVIRKPWVGMTQGFWQDDIRYLEAYWSRWPKTWVHGDWVQMDESGMYYITGRSDDTIKIAGKRLGPAEMESVLVAHPMVIEAVTIGVPDADKGEAAVCFVVVKVDPDHSSAELALEIRSFVGERMGKALRPKIVHLIQELPKTRNGKILRRVVKAAYTGKSLGDLSSLENPKSVEEIHKVSMVMD